MGVINIVTGRGPEAGEALVSHPAVAKISFTGSTATGRRIGELAGRNLKRHTLELVATRPSCSMTLILTQAVPGAATAISMNSGQSASGLTDFYVAGRRLRRGRRTLACPPAECARRCRPEPRCLHGSACQSGPEGTGRSISNEARSAGCEILRGVDVDEGNGHFVSPAVVLGSFAGRGDYTRGRFGLVLSVYKFEGRGRRRASCKRFHLRFSGGGLVARHRPGLARLGTTRLWRGDREE